jgi:signal transduction histidine kinase
LQEPTRLKRALGKLLPEGSGEEAHRARILTVAGLVFAAGGVLFSVVQVIASLHPAFPPAPAIDLVTDALVTLVGGLLVWLVRSIRIRSAAWLGLVCLLGIATAQSYVEGRPAADIAGGLMFFLVIALAFVLLDRRSAWLVCLASTVSFVAIHVLWLGGRLPPQFPRDPSGQVVFSVLSWLATAGIVAAVISSTMGALRKHREHLEEMVDEHTRELHEAQEQLLRRERLAVLGQFAGGVGHELRIPLGTIKNAAHFLNSVLDEPDPEVRQTLDLLKKEVGTSERIISSLLGYARPEPTTWRKVDANELVQEALSRSAIPESIDVASRLADGLPTILADPDQLALVLGNIIRNAVQAMPDGGRLTVTSDQCSEEAPMTDGCIIDPWIKVAVSDTGVGIPDEDVERIFEPLFTTRARGLGLVLALARSLVEGHGGSIQVQSVVGEGSTFAVKLPVGGERGGWRGEEEPHTRGSGITPHRASSATRRIVFPVEGGIR